MSSLMRAPPADVPTLTEVVPVSDLAEAAAAASALASIDEDRLAQQIIGELQAQAASALEARLRGQLPAWGERLAQVLLDALVDEVRDEIARGLDDVVRRAVADEVARARAR